jgi:tetratricopeptide (TPR) repeat protein
MLQVDLGVIFFEAGRYDEALPLFQLVAENDPDNSYATYYLARTLEQMGQLSEAASLYEKLLISLPDYPKLYYQLGNIKAGEGKTTESYYFLGSYYWLQGDMLLAKRSLSRAITEATGSDKLIKEKAGELLERIKRIEKNSK